MFSALMKCSALIFIAVIIGLSPVSALAEVVEAIKIVGNKKIEKDAVIQKLTNQTGTTLDELAVRDEVKKLFATGYFQDIEVSANAGTKGGVILTYKVVEKPSVSAVEYKGNSEIDDDELSELTKIKVFEIIDYAKITHGVADILKAYEEKGYFLAKVKYRVEDDSRNGVKIIFDITENDRVLVKRISFIGNGEVPASDIKARMQTREGGFFSFVSGSGTYKQDAFEQDIQLISFLYFNKGYVKAKVSRPEVTVTPDKKGIYITIRVEEGEQYHTGEVSFSGDLLFTTEELTDTATIDGTDVFVYETVQTDIKAFTAKYGDLGYAYTNVIPRTFIRDEDKKVDIVYDFDKGKKVYFGTINVVGNSRTRDKVVRRQLRIGEGELYNETKKRESLANIRRLGFFEQVQFNTKTPEGRDDLMDIDIVVKERNTGSFQLGAGYSSFSGPIFNAQLNQQNFLGKGQNVGLQINYSKIQKSYRLNFTDPYYNDTLWSVGTDLYRNDNNIPGLYRQKVEGGAFRIGHPIWGRYFYGFIRAKIDDTVLNMTPGINATDRLVPSSAEGMTRSITASVEYDKRNDRFNPTKGIHTSASYEVAGIGGGLTYQKADAYFRFYHNLFWNLIFRTNLAYGIVQGPKNRPIPFTKRYRLGGPFNMRGFNFSQVGRTEFSDEVYNYQAGNPPFDGSNANLPTNSNPVSDELAKQRAQVVVGGTQQVLAMFELVFPLVKDAGIRGVTFYDVGLADNEIIGRNFRRDYGFGIRWFSPIGPLRFEWGIPVERRYPFREQASKFNFAIGTPF